MRLDLETSPKARGSLVSSRALIVNTRSPDQDKGLSPRDLLWLVQPSSGGFFQQGITHRTSTCLRTWAVLPGVDEHGLGRAPPHMGHLTCVCFDFVVPSWKPELPVKKINKMDVMLILQCYYQQGGRTSVQLASGP